MGIHRDYKKTNIRQKHSSMEEGMFKGHSRKGALQIYRDNSSENQALTQSNVIEYVPAHQVKEPTQGSVNASQIIHTQNIHNYHYPATTPQTDKPQTKKASTEEAVLWFAGIVSVTFSFGFLIAVLIRG